MRGNRIERTGSDGIIVANSISPLIDGNLCYDAGALGNREETKLIAGVWVCAASNALIQRNEVARTRPAMNGEGLCSAITITVRRPVRMMRRKWLEDQWELLNRLVTYKWHG